ncbi:MAG: hypothetical protein K0S19_1594 [Geminicoccaceae bacterium]|jgi:hypothetical protein|nr:hypothetical protein [Geminicoccaceae bacterium]
MIQAREIMALAEELNLRPDVVEKDYVLGWMLHGIGSHPELAPAWIFKGGTCLKKRTVLELLRYVHGTYSTSWRQSFASESCRLRRPASVASSALPRSRVFPGEGHRAG